MLDTHLRVEVPEGIEIHLPLAGPVVRCLAFLIDTLIRVGTYLIIGLIFQLMGHFGIGLFFILIFLLEWFYPVIFEMFNQGATPGKKLMGIAVVNDDGTPVDWSSSIVRNLLRAADMFPVLYLTGILSMLLNKQFKRLGDLAAGTLVIHKKTYSHSGNLPQAKPKQARLQLTLEEQSAILHFGERSKQLSQARAHELANILNQVVDGQSAEDRMSNIMSLANWLRGRR
ncbi:RDD family protein [Pleionea litopenaei]|uniref:RDD family protein n=1 Tax=Pleionea litopenaei TaxID=3070815 RepID=A0AA51RQX5_9GAMM|nr:RDD family protein [Pleionea sp. HL-JVS1]WMS85819.1 RDD family protein [Pleionea sp. HL-JVS1]